MKDANGKIIYELVEHKVSCIPNSTDKFMTFSLGDIKFIDSFKFMGASLDKLVENLYDGKDRYKHVVFMKKEYPKHYEILTQKGYYPYDWMDNIDKVKYIGLLERRYVYNSMTRKILSEKDYAHAVNVYNTLKCESFRDYTVTYLKM